MQRSAVPMSEETSRRVPELLAAHGVSVAPYRDLGEFKMLKCERDGRTVILSVTRPAHWVNVQDERRYLVVVAAIAGSLFRFWRIPRDNRLRREIIELLRPHGWQPK
jgi:hypothetical protein